MLLPALYLWLSVAGLIQEGRQFYQEGRYDEARKSFEQAAKTDPTARLWLAYTEVALDELEPALRKLERLEPRFGSDEEYLFAASEAYTRRARQLAEKLVALGEHSARAHQHLAHRYRAVGDSRNAMAELLRAIELRPELPGLHIEAAELLWEQKQYEEAARELQAELRLSPLDFLANLRYGQFLLRNGKYKEAIAPLSIAARYRKYPEAFELLAYAWKRLGNFAEAAAVVNGGVVLFPDDSGLRDMLGSLPKSEGVRSPSPLVEPRPNLARLRAALGRDPRDEEALFALSQHYSEEAQRLFEKLERLAPGSYRLLQIKGRMAESAEDFQTAESYYRQVIADHPNLPGAHFALGHVLGRQGKEEEALTELQAELRIDPRHPLAMYELGAALLKRGDVGAALPVLRQSVQLQPSFVESRTELAKALLQAKRPLEAVKALQAVVRAQPEHPTAHYLLFRAFSSTGDAAAAKQELAVHQQLMKNRTKSRGPQGGMGDRP